MNRGPLSPSRVGVLLLDAQARPVHFNAESASILGYPKQLRHIPSLGAVLPAINGQLGSPSSAAPSNKFTSGRRQYVCRVFLLDSNKTNSRVQPKYVVVLERVACAPQVDVSRWSEQYQLTTRERETVEHVLQGLSTKEIATKMSISPSTVKTFLKLIMMKVGTSSRTGIIAKIQRGEGHEASHG